jgi:uncharacterized protein YegL
MSEALRKVLDKVCCAALTLDNSGSTKAEARKELREGIAMLRSYLSEQPEPEQEPVAWMIRNSDGKPTLCYTEEAASFQHNRLGMTIHPLYTTQPAPKRLSEDVIEKIRQSEWCYMLNKQEFRDLVRVIENAVRGG